MSPCPFPMTITITPRAPEGRHTCRFIFSLNMAPLIMQSVLKAVLAQDETINREMLAYINDIFINKDVASVKSVRKHLELNGLITRKDPEKLQNSARVLGLEVSRECVQL